jgi:hypothetical protein
MPRSVERRRRGVDEVDNIGHVAEERVLGVLDRDSSAWIGLRPRDQQLIDHLTSKTIICNSLASYGLKVHAIEVPVSVAPVGIEGVTCPERAGKRQGHALKGDMDIDKLLAGYLRKVDVEQLDKSSFVEVVIGMRLMVAQSRVKCFRNFDLCPKFLRRNNIDRKREAVQIGLQELDAKCSAASTDVKT